MWYIGESAHANSDWQFQFLSKSWGLESPGLAPQTGVTDMSRETYPLISRSGALDREIPAPSSYIRAEIPQLTNSALI